MFLQELYEKILESTKEGDLVFNEETLGELGALLETYFQEVFGSAFFELHSVVCNPPADGMLTLKGAVQDDIDAEVSFLAQRSRVYMQLLLLYRKETEMDFFPSYRLAARDASLQYRFALEEKEEIPLSRSGVLLQSVTYAELLAMILGGLTEMNRTALKEPFVLNGIRLTAADIYEGNIHKKRVAVESDATLGITDKIRVGNLGIMVTRSDTVYDLELKGQILFQDKTLPVMMYENGNVFTFGLCATGEEVGDLALKDLLALVDISFADFLPEYFSVLTNIRLERFLLYLPYDFSTLQGIQVSLASPEPWKFIGIDSFLLSDIRLGVDVRYTAGETWVKAEISGRLSIASFCMDLCGTADGDGFTFQGQMPQDSSLNMKTVLESFAAAFGLGTVSLPIPDILLKLVFISIDTSEKRGKPLRISAFVNVQEGEEQADTDIALRLLNIEARIEVESVQKDGSRTYGGTLAGNLEIAGQDFAVTYEFGRQDNDRIEASWKSDDAGVSLVTLLEEFYVTDIPEIVRSISLELNAASITYFISKKELVLKLSSKQVGDFSAYIWEDEDGRFQYALKLQCTRQIGLSALPVVGRDFGLLDSAKISGVVLAAASKAHGTIKSGVSLSGKVLAGEGSYPFLLEIGGDSSEMTADSASGEVSKWFEINKSLGIFSFRRIAVTYRDGALGFLLDASLSASPIGITLMGIGLGVGLQDPSQIKFFLSGLGISFRSGTLGIDGAFVCNADDSYDGELLVRASSLSLYAIGSYQDKSMFAYALLSGQIGGPPAFFVTGIAAGFGYNRSLVIPAIEDINRFPLVRAAFGTLDRSEMIREMKSYITMSGGSNFLAAGVKFTSFKMIDSFVLCSVLFGERLEIGAVGLSEISIPAHVETSPIAYAQLALRAVCVPQDGYVSVMAQLTRESYVLSRDCKITGGFAFYLWFGGEHKGDFVITLGGYHPSYRKPGHYPDVPRLGFKWCVTSSLTLSGELYFAVTPRCLMAGGSLNAVYESGNLRAWFIAKADFFIAWKPFHYDIGLYIGLGASYRMKLLFCHVTFSVELSADLKIWGPDFSGKARITWFIISFTIEFGNAKNEKRYLGWDEFAQSFLTQDRDGNGEDLEVLAFAYTDGLSRQEDDGDAFVDAEALKLDVRSKVPITDLYINGEKCAVPDAGLGVLPMGDGKKLESSCEVTVKDSAGKARRMQFGMLAEAVPSALWGLKDDGLNGKNLLENVCVGVQLAPIVRQTFPTLPPDGWLTMEGLTYQIEREFLWNAPVPVKGPTYPQEDTIHVFTETAGAADVAEARAALLSGWRDLGFEIEVTDIDLTALARDAQDLFLEDIRLSAMV